MGLDGLVGFTPPVVGLLGLVYTANPPEVSLAALDNAAANALAESPKINATLREGRAGLSR